MVTWAFVLLEIGRQHDQVDRARARQRRLSVSRSAEVDGPCCSRDWCTSSWSGSSCSRLPGGPKGDRQRGAAHGDTKQRVEWGLGGAAALAGAAAASYAGFVGDVGCATATRHAPAADEADPLLDVFMPSYDIAERHHIGVGAPADVTFGALMDMDLEQSLLIRAIFKGRELLLGAEPDTSDRPAASSQ